jgi:hypothetical protein
MAVDEHRRRSSDLLGLGDHERLAASRNQLSREAHFPKPSRHPVRGLRAVRVKRGISADARNAEQFAEGALDIPLMFF